MHWKKWLLRKLLMASLLATTSYALSFEVYEQPWDGTSIGVNSQAYPDVSELSAYAFDDITVTDPYWSLKGLTFYGLEAGNENITNLIEIRISQFPSHTNTGIVPVGRIFPRMHMSQGVIRYDFLSVTYLPQGTWWLSVWIHRQLNPGGQWFWYQTTPVRASEGYIHNPAGGAGFGTEPIPLSQLPGASGPRDLAFRLEYDPIPEPDSLTAVGFGALLLLLRKRLR